ncbi:hypothetical protein HKX48_004454 [Thoreauomyces humboldtii]|nr:hypothetical protein HKX48_004454 [Thoreauomyces humboldtii]
MAGNGAGVRAQPKTLKYEQLPRTLFSEGSHDKPSNPNRPPSAIANIGSYLGGISSYVAQNLPDKLNWHPQGGDTTSDPLAPADLDPEEVLSAKFCWVDWPGAASGHRRRLCLFLGYLRGFQVWDVTDPDNVQEVVSLRRALGQAHSIEPVPNPVGQYRLEDHLKEYRPLLAIVTDKASTVPDVETPTREIKFFSMRSHEVVHTLEFGGDAVLEVRSTSRVIVVALASYALHIYSNHSLERIARYDDLMEHPLQDRAAFDVGMRYIMYATTTPAPAPRRRSATTLGGDSDSDADPHEDQNLARKMAGKVAKDLVVGAKVIGDYGYQALSSYFTHPTKSGDQTAERAEASLRDGALRAPHRAEYKPPANSGTIVIRSLPPVSSSHYSAIEAIAHWKPHHNPISVVRFSPNQTIALTASIQANTFYLWEIPGRSSTGKTRSSVRCLYKLERGYTMATVEDITFSWDSRWVGVTTARGTTHVYKIDPVVARENSAALAGTAEGRLNVINGLTEARAVPFGNAVIPSTDSGSGIPSIYPITRVKRHLPDSLLRMNAGSGSAHILYFFLPFYLVSAASRKPRMDPDAGPVPTGTTARPLLSLAVGAVRGLVLKEQSNGKGVLMIHHIDVITEDSTGPYRPPSPSAHLPPPHSASGGRSSSSWDPHRFSPSSLLSTTLLTLGSPKRHQPAVKVSDIMEWNVKREPDWAEVRGAVASTPRVTKSTKSTKNAPAKPSRPIPPVTVYWPAKIEIRSYQPSLRPPVWMGPQFVFEVLDRRAPLRGRPSPFVPAPDLSELPLSTEIHVKREAPKPHGEISTPSSHFPTLHPYERMQENILTAMDSTMEFKSYQPIPVPASGRRNRSEGGLKESLSFEDAFQIPLDTPREPVNKPSPGFLGPLSRVRTTTSSAQSQGSSNSSRRSVPATPSPDEDPFDLEDIPAGGIVIHEDGDEVILDGP